MTTKTHQLLGLGVATAGVFTLYPEQALSWPIAWTILTGSFVGSILPDIDQPSSNFWDSVPLGKLLGRLAPHALGGHRNLSHSILGYFLFSWLVYWVVTTAFRDGLFDVGIFMLSFKLGFVAHLAADAVTVQGIPLFWPLGGNMGFPPRPFEGIRIVTGKWFENFVVFPVALFGYAFLLSLHPAQVCPIIELVCR